MLAGEIPAAGEWANTLSSGHETRHIARVTSPSNIAMSAALDNGSIKTRRPRQARLGVAALKALSWLNVHFAGVLVAGVLTVSSINSCKCKWRCHSRTQLYATSQSCASASRSFTIFVICIFVYLYVSICMHIYAWTACVIRVFLDADFGPDPFQIM